MYPVYTTFENLTKYYLGKKLGRFLKVFFSPGAIFCADTVGQWGPAQFLINFYRSIVLKKDSTTKLANRTGKKMSWL